jgi:hypothetical protein
VGGPDSGRVTDKPEVISSPIGVSTDKRAYRKLTRYPAGEWKDEVSKETPANENQPSDKVGARGEQCHRSSREGSGMGRRCKPRKDEPPAPGTSLLLLKLSCEDTKYCSKGLLYIVFGEPNLLKPRDVGELFGAVL